MNTRMLMNTTKLRTAVRYLSDEPKPVNGIPLRRFAPGDRIRLHDRVQDALHGFREAVVLKVGRKYLHVEMRHETTHGPRYVTKLAPSCVADITIPNHAARA